MKKIDIKGSEYVPVNERVKHFLDQDEYKGWRIITDIHTVTDASVIIKASILNAKGDVMATGHGQEFAGSSFINKSSYVENCETSAVGRALGMLGIGIDTSIASFEEVANAVKQQGSKPVSGKKSAGSVADKPWLNPRQGANANPTWTEAVKYLSEGGKMSDIKGKYRLAKANEDKLQEEALSYNDIPGLNSTEPNLGFDNQEDNHNNY